MAAAGDEGDRPDPVALLRAVENERLAIKSGRLDLDLDEVDLKHSKGRPDQVRLTVLFQNEARRYDQYQRTLFVDGNGPGGGEAKQRILESMGHDRDAFVRAGHGKWKNVHVRSAFDGSRLIQYSEDLGVYVSDPSKGSGDFVFDPRILGIAVTFDMNETVEKSLMYRGAKFVTLVGREETDAGSAWHVSLRDKYDQDRDFWIKPGGHFHVVRSSFKDKYQQITTTSRYRGDVADGRLPSEIHVLSLGRKGQPVQETRVTLTRADIGAPVDPKAWTLAGMGLPIGQAVIDQREHRRAGYWDGEGLTEDYTEARNKSVVKKWRPLHWGMIFSGVVVLAILLGAIIQRRNLLRQAE